MQEIKHLSYSSISAYLQCPRSWKFKYIEKPPVETSPNLVFGSAFHETVEKKIGGDDRDLVVIWSDEWNDQVNPERAKEIAWDKPKEDYEQLGTLMCKSKVINQQVSAMKPLFLNNVQAIEKYVELHVPGVPLPIIGYIDIITDDGVPGDLKTAARKWAAGKAEDETQPLFYLAALNQEGYDLNPDMKFRHYVFTKTKTPDVQVIETQWRLQDIFLLFEQIAEVWKGIEREVFPTNWAGWKCSEKYCDFWKYCRGR